MRGQSSHYFFCAGSTFENGRALCQGFGADLAVIGDAAENELIRAQAAGDVYLGLIDENGCTSGTCDFTWVNQEPLSFTNWNTGEPNNTGGGEHCVELEKASGRWNDVPCSDALGIVCEMTCPQLTSQRCDVKALS